MDSLGSLIPQGQTIDDFIYLTMSTKQPAATAEWKIERLNKLSDYLYAIYDRLMNYSRKLYKEELTVEEIVRRIEEINGGAQVSTSDYVHGARVMSRLENSGISDNFSFTDIPREGDSAALLDYLHKKIDYFNQQAENVFNLTEALKGK